MSHPTPEHDSPVQRGRAVERVLAGTPTSDGAGVRLTRVVAQPLQRRLDPVLMLDTFATEAADDYIAGFPDHPHRGFETVTYMLHGRMRHRDSAGHEGLLRDGDVQWMTTGRGLVHSELPEQTEGRMEGFQLWLNLPAADKMQPPSYRDIPSREIPEWRGDGVTVRVIAGESQGVRGAVQRPVTQPLLLDVALEPGARFAQPLPPSFNAFAYVFRGALQVGGTAVAAGTMALLANDDGDGVVLQAQAQPGRALLVAAQPLNEPIAQYGPFVMNTADQLRQAVEDFRAGRIGR